MPLQDYSITNPQQFPFVRMNAISFGHIASFYYLSHLTIRSFLTNLSIKIEPVEAPILVSPLIPWIASIINLPSPMNTLWCLFVTMRMWR